MKTKMLIAIIIFLGLSGCDESEEELNTLAAAMTNLSTAVEAVCRKGDSASSLEDAKLVAFAATKDPDLAKPFASYTLRARCRGKHGVILLCKCDGNKSRAILEDAGCTGVFDRHAWKDANKPACEYALSIPKVCGR